MKGIKAFLSKFRLLIPPDQFIKKECVLVIKEMFGIEIKKESLSLKNNTIYINNSSTIKSELFIKKESLLVELSKRISKYNKNITDIR